MYNRIMKKIIILFLICFLSYSGVVRAEVETTENKAFMSPDEVREYMKYMDEPEEVQRAREAIFNGENKIVEQIDVSEYKDYFVDKKYSPNQKFRYLNFYSDGSYLWQKDYNSFFIYLKGKLIYIGKNLNYVNNITIRYIYNNKGFLKYIIYNNKKDIFSYVFDNNKKYLYKWYDSKCYNTEDVIILRNRPFIPFN